MKKKYIKPQIMKRDNLSAATAQVISGDLGGS